MKSRNVIQSLLAVAMAVTCASAAFAQDQDDYLMRVKSQPAAPGALTKYRSENAPLGVSAQGMTAERTIRINAATKYLNVNQGEVVALVSDDKAFTWKFDTLGTGSFELAKIAPQDFAAGKVVVYVNEVVQSD
jgi:hypothetical protein